MEATHRKREVQIPAGGSVRLSGALTVPEGATGVVLFAHGSGSSRLSPRNRAVARALRAAGLGTVLMDLLTPAEEELERYTRHLRFDVALLARRLMAATDWLASDPDTASHRIGYFGSSTGAAAALMAAAIARDVVGAVVSRGGRPDLAGPALRRVIAPTLFIVGSRDLEVLELNRMAFAAMPRTTEKSIELVRGATHLFEEPGALDRVAELAAGWFREHLARRAQALHPAP